MVTPTREVTQELREPHSLSRCSSWKKYAIGVITLWAWLGLATLGTLAAPETGTIKGEILSAQRVPIGRALCNLSGPSLPQQGLKAVTGQSGKFDFPGLLWGNYRVTCGAIGYRPLSKGNLNLSLGHPLVEVQMVLPSETVLHQRVEVHASAGAIPEQQTAAPPSTFVSQQLMTLPLAELKFKAALPLVPGVVRTPDGKLNIKGEPETRGLLLVDSADMVDPVTSSFSVDVPIDAIEILQVYKSPYLAQYGGFSGGLTAIHTKPPSDQWHWELNDLIPDFFFEGGHMRGIQDDSPRLYFTGPLLTNKLSVSESFLYDLDKQIVEGLPWPRNLRKREGFSSFTDFQYIFSPRHLLSVNARIFPKKDEFANINALVPQPASESYAQNGYAVGATDRFLFASGGILTSTFEFTQFNTSAHGQGPEAMLVTPNGYSGNYFNTYRRWSDQEQSREAYQFPRREWHGQHQFEIGFEYFHRAYTGTSDSHPVLVTDASGSILERIDFSGPAYLGDTDTEIGGFGQDHWTINDHLSVDAGLRYADETLGSHTVFAPRLGFAYSPEASGGTVLRGGAGIFFDREPLLAADFPQNPTRTIRLFSPQGTLLGPPVRLANMYSVSGQAGRSSLPSLRRPDSTPYDETWSLELDQELHPGWLVRLSYLSSYGRDQFIVNPQYLPGSNPAFLLSNTGGSHYQEFVSTMRIRTGETADMHFSYIYSHARGNLNTLGEIYVPFQQPIIRPDVYTDLPSDMPSRLITWSEFHLPGAMTLSPVLDIHSGLPFSTINARQNYSGVPNSTRFPHFYSLDLKWTKKFRMSLLPFAKGHIFRVGIAVFDLTDHLNPLDVYNNIASPYFGHFAGFQHRTFATYFDLVK